MRIDLFDGVYVATCKQAEADLFRDAGWRFDRIRHRKWITDDWKRAVTFLDHAVGDAKLELDALLTEREEALSASYSMYAEADIPVPEMYNHKGERLDYLPYQKAGILYACERPDTLIADSPGLGKTIQAVGVINYLDLTSGLIVCPATLKLNWKKEMEKWLVDKSLTVGVAYGSDIPNTDFVIINYDILVRNKEALQKEQWGILVCDEAQYLQNPASGRTKVIFGEWYLQKEKRDNKGKVIRRAKEVRSKPGINAWVRLMLSGTPMMKRPKDLWPVIRDFDNAGLGASFYDFALNYCEGYEGPFGLVADGGSNLDELNELLRRRFMIRRLKTNVLKDLPPKTRQVIVLPPEGLKKRINTERDKFTNALAMLAAANDDVEYNPKVALEEVDPSMILDTMCRLLGDGFESDHISELEVGEVEPGFAAFSEARHELALSKVPMAVEHVNRLLEAGEKVIVFAIHRDVVQQLYEAFPQAARIIGGMSPKKVEAEKLRFQGDKDKGIPPEPGCNIILGNLKAAGVGHTLTEATVVVFVEMWAVPGDMEQCEDRAHRFGLEHNVLVQYLVVQGTMDAMTIDTLIKRIEMIEQGVDGADPYDLRKAA